VVKPYQKIEEQLRLRPPGWWEWVVGHIPELASLAQTPQPPEFHPEGDAAVHTQLAVAACLAGEDPDLLWAALLHDIGKAETTRSDAGRITSHGHDIVGAEMAEKILQRIRMPVARRTRIVWAVRHHMFHMSWQLNTSGQASKRQKKMVADERFPFLLELLRVDSEASPHNPRGMKAYVLYKELRRRVAGGE
jgi:poly(A) polymerase